MATLVARGLQLLLRPDRSLDASLPLREERTSSRSPAHIEECAPGRFYARRVRAWLRRSSGLQLRQVEIVNANARRHQLMQQCAEQRGQQRVFALDEVQLLIRSEERRVGRECR